MINILYEELKPIILSNISDEYVEKVDIGFKKYLNDTYEFSFNESEHSENRLKTYIDLEKKIWTNTPSIVRLSRFVYDPNFEKLTKLSDDIFWLAKEKSVNNYEIKKDISDDDIKKMINYIFSIAREVEFFNYQKADDLANDAILDYLFIYRESSNISKRLKRELENIPSLNTK